MWGIFPEYFQNKRLPWDDRRSHVSCSPEWSSKCGWDGDYYSSKRVGHRKLGKVNYQLSRFFLVRPLHCYSEAFGLTPQLPRQHLSLVRPVHIFIFSMPTVSRNHTRKTRWTKLGLVPLDTRGQTTPQWSVIRGAEPRRNYGYVLLWGKKAMLLSWESRYPDLVIQNNVCCCKFWIESCPRGHYPKTCCNCKNY